jgi:hypothetical protein
MGILLAGFEMTLAMARFVLFPQMFPHLSTIR